ncbi:hypothetical protein FJY90_03150 [Candidatus Gottesmanbacteria bacterium]|nr:hypothetical protein [Candidatus Gottesmanbacteria bacterium]
MKELISQHPDIYHRIRLTRRKFLAFLGLALVSGITAYLERYKLRQWLKEILKEYFPALYQEAAKWEEYGLKFLGMPVRVNLYEYQDREVALLFPAGDEMRDIRNVQEAVDFFQKYPRVPLGKKVFVDPQSLVRFQTFNLPQQLTDNKSIRIVLGLGITTLMGESLPGFSLAMKVDFPSNIRSTVAPAVPIPNFTCNEATRRYRTGDYRALNLPRYLLSQTVLSTGHDGNDLQVVPNAERMVILGVDIQGQDFNKGGIADGTVYLWANQKGWGLADWPDDILRRADTSCVRMFWNLNPYQQSQNGREFLPYALDFLGEQATQQHGFINHFITGADYQPIGPTAVFRTDRQTGQSDIIYIAPFLPLVAPHILKEILIETPVGVSEQISHHNDLLIAMADAKYNTMWGYGPGIFSIPDRDSPKVYDTQNILSGNEDTVSDFFSMNNSLALYMGYD